MKKTKKFKENRPENYHVHDNFVHCKHVVSVMDMVIFRTIFFELLVFFTFTLLTLHFAY